MSEPRHADRSHRTTTRRRRTTVAAVGAAVALALGATAAAAVPTARCTSPGLSTTCHVAALPNGVRWQ